MFGWKINPTNLEEGLTRYMEETPSPDELKIANDIVYRMSTEQGGAGVVSPNELYAASQDLLFAQANNQYHYLLNQDPRLVSAIFLTIDSALQPKKSRAVRSTPPVLVSEPHEWNDFLENLNLKSPGRFDRFVAGARAMRNTIQVIQQDRFLGGAYLLTMPGDTVDIRFNTLVKTTFKVSQKLVDEDERKKTPIKKKIVNAIYRLSSWAREQVPSKKSLEKLLQVSWVIPAIAVLPIQVVWRALKLAPKLVNLPFKILNRLHNALVELPQIAERRLAKINNRFGEMGLGKPPSWQEFHDAINRLRLAVPDLEFATDKEVLGRIKNNPDHLRDFKLMHSFIVAYGDKRNARDAAEVRVNLRSQRYELRADHPIGVPTEKFPHHVDGTNRESVMNFLKNEMMMKDIITPENENEVWHYWSTAWTQNLIKPGDFEVDLDKTCFEYKMKLIMGKIFGHEKVSMRYLTVALAAMALRHKKAHHVTSHTHRGRLSDLLNESELALLRFSLTLRTLKDPPVRQEELRGMKEAITTFENITFGEGKILRKFLKDDVPMTALAQKDGDPDQIRVVQRAFVAVNTLRILGKAAKAIVVRGANVMSELKKIGTRMGMALRGHKDAYILKNEGKTKPGRGLIDDTLAECNSFIESGGDFAILTPVKSYYPDFQNSAGVIDLLLNAFENLARDEQEGAGYQKVIYRARDKTFDQSVPIKHRQWPLKAYYGWLSSMIPLFKLKGRIRMRAARELPSQVAKQLMMPFQPVAKDFRQVVLPFPETTNPIADLQSAQSSFSRKLDVLSRREFNIKRIYRPDTSHLNRLHPLAPISTKTRSYIQRRQIKIAHIGK